MNNPRYANVNQMATYLSVSESAIRKWIRTGQIPVTRINGSIRFDLQAVDAYFAKKS